MSNHFKPKVGRIIIIMNEIRVRIKDLIKELEMLQKDGYECADLTIEEAEEGIPARIMLSDYGCVFECKD
jgi:hypothetical protein